MQKIFTILLIVITVQVISSQSLYTTKMDSLLLADSGYVPNQALVDSLNPRKPLWFPASEAIGLNLGLGAFNTYVAKSEFAKISFKTIKHNYETGWSTDADALITNMWAHPFHGSMYYNFARSSGYNYWTSLGIAALGSWQWEFHMENEPPALNDWWMTSYGGSMLGEMFYRFSNLILDESTTGWQRFWHELGAGVFNPARLFNRLISGQATRVTDAKLYEKQPLMGELAAGGNNVAEGLDFDNGKKNLMITLDITYGKLFSPQTVDPFDFFRFYGAFNFGGEGEDKQPLFGQFRIYNNFYTETSNFSNGSKFLWGIFGHYDFLNNNVYELGGVSAGLGIGYQTPGTQTRPSFTEHQRGFGALCAKPGRPARAFHRYAGFLGQADRRHRAAFNYGHRAGRGTLKLRDLGRSTCRLHGGAQKRTDQKPARLQRCQRGSRHSGPTPGRAYRALRRHARFREET